MPTDSNQVYFRSATCWCARPLIAQNCAARLSQLPIRPTVVHTMFLCNAPVRALIRPHSNTVATKALHILSVRSVRPHILVQQLDGNEGFAALQAVILSEESSILSLGLLTQSGGIRAARRKRLGIFSETLDTAAESTRNYRRESGKPIEAGFPLVYRYVYLVSTLAWASFHPNRIIITVLVFVVTTTSFTCVSVDSLDSLLPAEVMLPSVSWSGFLWWAADPCVNEPHREVFGGSGTLVDRGRYQRISFPHDNQPLDLFSDEYTRNFSNVQFHFCYVRDPDRLLSIYETLPKSRPREWLPSGC